MRVVRGIALVFCAAGSLLAADPEGDAQALQVVCGRCHTTDVFANKPRSWGRWNDVFADMTQRGARGSNDQLARVTRYFLENLTLVNVNTSEAEELGGVLGVDDDVVTAILERRKTKPFAGLADLKSIPGVNAAVLEARKSRIQF